ncbi:MAG: DUF2510 domain-containing protein [Actinomycetota bacterium]|nr:DUF2510 domain-containing protein [Actinomycetota bacterium]
MSAPAGWYPDPTRRHGERYWAGAHWTEHVRDRGKAGIDPLDIGGEQSGEAVRTSVQRDLSRATTAPQGWYPSPGVPEEERYWDGTRWTNYTRPARSWPAQGVAGTAAAARTNGKAVASLTLALVWLGGIASVPAIVLGLLARREIDRSSGGQRGSGLASAGIVVGLLGLLLAGVMFAMFVVLVLLARQ